VNETHWWRCGAIANASATPITAAVENATTGETIYVFDGSYDKESANVDKRLTLQGESVAGVNVAATALGEHVFNVTANYVNISGFNVIGATGSGKAGFYLNGVEHCNVSGNNASGNYYGIYMNSAGNNTLMSNTAKTNTEYGIYLNLSSNNTVKKNTVAKNKDGVYLDSAGSNNITCNWLYNNTRAGFNLTGGSIGNNISHNNIVENGVAQGSEIYYYQFYNNQVNDVNASYNWWGTNNGTKINESIYDKLDEDPTKGIVNFSNYRSYEDPCAPIPELSTVILVGVGLVVLAGYVRIRRRRR
jgi:parallel beta-helix repeat protein